MRSMTGFGRARCEVSGRRFVVEVRSVNHRFLDLKSRLPWPDPFVEQQLGAAVRKRLNRGAVSVSVREDAAPGTVAEVAVDLDVAQAWARALGRIADACGLSERPSLSLIVSQAGVVQQGAQAEPGEALWAAIHPGVEAALDELSDARTREGAALGADLSARGQSLRRLAAEIGRLAEDAPAEARKRLDERIKRLLGDVPGVQLDPQRLAQEVALLADRADIAEELTRLSTHLDELDRLLADREPAGRRLDFLVQEIHREINTIGSKSQRAEIAARVVEAKAEVERIREQVQNIE